MDEETLQWLNQLPADQAIEQFRRSCAAEPWCEKLASSRPFATVDSLHQAADTVFDRLTDDDWLEAFAAHPMIGDMASLRMKYTGNREWSAGEQAGVAVATEQTLQSLAELNLAYREKFGFIFIVCASGKSASEMLELLMARIGNEASTELRNAAAEQRKITHLRIDKMIIPVQTTIR
jgi:2-oxo-4-hydroxy-4-carboxy-5-ureidoimidazoline decarboxylase